MIPEAGKTFWWMAGFHAVAMLAILGFFGLGSGAVILLALVALSYFNQLKVDADALDQSRELVFRFRGKGPFVWPFAKIPEGYWAAVGWFGQECHFQRGGIALIPLFFGEMTLVSIQLATDNVAEALNDTADGNGKKAFLTFPTKDAPISIQLAVTMKVFDDIPSVRRMAYEFTNPNEPRDRLLARASASARAFCGTKTTNELVGGRDGTRDASANEALRDYVNAALLGEATLHDFPMEVHSDTANILPAPEVLAAMADKEAAKHQAAAGVKRAEVIGAQEHARSEGEVGGLVAAAKGLDADATVRVTQLAQAMGTMRAGNRDGTVFIAGQVPDKLEVDVRGMSRGGDGDVRRRPDSKGRDKSDKKGS